MIDPVLNIVNVCFSAAAPATPPSSKKMRSYQAKTRPVQEMADYVSYIYPLLMDLTEIKPFIPKALGSSIFSDTVDKLLFWREKFQISLFCKT